MGAGGAAFLSTKDQLAAAKAEIKRLNGRIEQLQMPRVETRLSRSSFETYVGLGTGIILAVLPMTWWLRIALFALLDAMCADVCWRSPVSHGWPKKAKGLAVIVFCGWISWVGYGNIRNSYIQQKFPQNQDYMTRWGSIQGGSTVIQYPNPDGSGGSIHGEAASEVIVDGSKVMRYANEYRLWAVCFHNTGYSSFNTQAVSGSNLFDINDGQIAIKILWNAQYQYEIIHRMTTTTYGLLLIPKSIKSATGFSTIQDALDKGGVVLHIAAGPP
jgi:hypothetical protein